MLRKQDLYDKAVSLRRKGLSYNEILDVVPVGHGTMSRWCSGIELTEKQKKRIKEKRLNTPLIKNLIESSSRNKGEDVSWAEKAVSRIKIDEKSLLLSGILLYWAEGYNSDKSQSAVFTNTDPEMIKLVMKFFREVLSVSDSKIKAMVRIGEEGEVKKAEKYWSIITSLPLERFQKPEILRLKENSKSLERYPNGICRISVYDVRVRRKIDRCIKLFKDSILSPRSSTG
ncbi:MAG: hypothetical protein WC468_01215 [Candidatus Paceibacterota bacterium]